MDMDMGENEWINGHGDLHILISGPTLKSVLTSPTAMLIFAADFQADFEGYQAATSLHFVRKVEIQLTT